MLSAGLSISPIKKKHICEKRGKLGADMKIPLPPIDSDGRCLREDFPGGLGKINFGQALIWSKSPCETDPLAGFSAVAGLKYPNAMAFIIFLVSIFLVQLS